MIQTFSCSPPAAGAQEARPPRRAKSSKRFTIDIHCHLHIEAADKLVDGLYDPSKDPIFGFASASSREVNRKQMASLHGKLTSIEERLADMDRYGIDVQAMSPAPHQYCYWAPPEAGLNACRAVNEGIAGIVEKHPLRFVGMGCVPMQEPRLAVQELQRMVKELDLRGVEIGTNVNGRDLSDDAYRPFFAKAEELGILVFMHPLGTTEGRRLAEHYLVNIVGNLLDSTIAVSRLIFDGVLDAYPDLKVCVAHGGGYLPFYPARMDHAHAVRLDCRERISKPPTSYLKKLHFDTVVFDPRQLEYLVDLYGREQLLLGTDYPYDMSEIDPVRFVESAKKLTERDLVAICGGNAARLLRIRR